MNLKQKKCIFDIVGLVASGVAGFALGLLWSEAKHPWIGGSLAMLVILAYVTKDLSDGFHNEACAREEVY